ncbi:proteasome subunit beta type 1 [Plasmodium ovale curtisi]|uniref:Proteasome subunit beta type 1 n=1 Tax=Plasmodium ovale curtisi TaxID=864141 RepID=A0A1A8VXG6_PLAOA|nr:proteasome subunit beta type 1 [Plasmodium ovale curtisi]SBS92605.1 proteasome subunit beta type 1 [Plasmodium ovale curtisi]
MIFNYAAFKSFPNQLCNLAPNGKRKKHKFTISIMEIVNCCPFAQFGITYATDMRTGKKGRQNEVASEFSPLAEVTLSSKKMEILPISDNSTNKRAEGKEGIIECGRSSKRWYPYIDNGGYGEARGNCERGRSKPEREGNNDKNCYRPNGKGLCDFSSRHATDKCVIGSSGMQSDIKTLHALLKKKIKIFFLEHAHYPDIHVIARLLCVILYSRRFFPYYTFNLLAGMSEDNESVLYNYDAIGSYCGATHSCVGSGAALILPILDNRVEQKNQLIKNVNFNLRDDIDFVKDAITSATERDIYTGDQAEIYIIDNMGVNTTSLDLKQD